MLSAIVAPAPILLLDEDVEVGVEKVPERAASKLNGSDEDEREPLKEGGSMREKGAEVRRSLLLSKPDLLRFVGERPAGAVRGARGEDMFARAGGLMLDVGGGMVLAVMVKVKGLKGLSEISLLLFLVGELRLAGSTFSLSKSSKMAGSNGRLVGEVMDMAGLPLETLLLETNPRFVSLSYGCQCGSQPYAYHFDGS